MKSSRRRRSRVAAAGGLGLWLLCAVVTAVWLRLAASVTEPDGSSSLPGLAADVRVFVDSFGVPSIFAGDVSDAARAQGYLHATDRLWQMEFTRRIAAGRLAEVFGEPAVSADRFIRTLDLWGRAARRLEGLGAEELARLDAYAEGVNARLREGGTPLPPEFQILRFRPEPWDAQSSVAIGLVMALDLTHWRRDLSRFKARPFLTPEQFEYLRMPYPQRGPTTSARRTDPPPISAALAPEIPTETAPETTSEIAAEIPVELPVAARTYSPAAADRSGDEEWDPLALLARYGVRAASNAWVVAGSRTASGHPLLANDMHLGLRTPGVWYLMALHAETTRLDVAGLTIPGLPGVIVGYNRNVAWGFTNGMVDDVDYALEEVSPDGRRYREGNVWKRFHVRTESIRVKGREEPLALRIRETGRGPLIGDGLAAVDTPMSVMWVNAQPGIRTLGQWEMAAADDLDSFDVAVSRLATPHLNVVFGTTAGEIGFRLSGSLPLRDWDGSVPVESRDVGPGPSRVWPPESHPAARNPRSGYFVTANNLQAPGLGRAISVDYALPYRALRITQALEVRRRWTVEETFSLQRDVHSLLAGRLLGRTLEAAERTGFGGLATALRGWDRRVVASSRVATVFYIWLYRLRQLLVSDELEPTGSWAFFPLDALERLILEGGGSPWADDVRTDRRETFEELSDQAFREAVQLAGGRPWGAVHFELHRHALSRSPLVSRLLSLDIGPYATEGGPVTVRPDDYGRWNGFDSLAWTPPLINEFGPTERFVADLTPGRATGFFLLPTGQSGNPFSRHYRDLNLRWRAGQPIEVPLSEALTRSRAVREFTLRPDGQGVVDGHRSGK